METLSTTHSSVDILREHQVGGTLLPPRQTQDAPILSILDRCATFSPVGARRLTLSVTLTVTPTLTLTLNLYY